MDVALIIIIILLLLMNLTLYEYNNIGYYIASFYHVNFLHNFTKQISTPHEKAGTIKWIQAYLLNHHSSHFVTLVVISCYWFTDVCWKDIYHVTLSAYYFISYTTNIYVHVHNQMASLSRSMILF